MMPLFRPPLHLTGSSAESIFYALALALSVIIFLSLAFLDPKSAGRSKESNDSDENAYLPQALKRQ